MLYRFELPPAFWNDHIDRRHEEAGIRNVMGKKGNRIMVELDKEAWDDLRSDAAYYCDPTGRPETPWLVRSARLTLDAVKAPLWGRDESGCPRKLGRVPM